MPFSFCHIALLALSNLHHSDLFRDTEIIEMDGIYKPIIQVFKPRLDSTLEIPEEWEIDRAEQRLLGGRA